MKVLVLPGDGIGPEIVTPTLQVLEAVDGAYALGLDLEIADIGLASLARRARRSRSTCSTGSPSSTG